MDGADEGITLQEHNFDTGEVEITYAEGPANGPPLVLLHGGGGSWQGLGPIIPALSARWQLYAPDLRGHGASGWTPHQYTTGDFARDIEGFLASVVREPAVLLGHSLGASTALIAAAHRPDQIRAVILGDAPKPLHREEHWHDYVQRIHGYAAGMRLPPGLSCDPTALTVFRDETERYLAGFDHALFRRVVCPVLILQADPAYGSQLNDADVAELLWLFPSARHAFISGCGHGLWSTQKEPALSVILAFLDTVGQPPAMSSASV